MKNRKASYNYDIEETYSAGIILQGDEIKSIRSGKCSFTDAYCVIGKNGVSLKGLYITKNSVFSPDETRDKLLLLNKKEISKIRNKFMVKGYSLIPMELVMSKGLVKIIVGVGRGRNSVNKKNSIKEKDIKRQTSREINQI
jgi:SsrA-binding protein